MLRIAEQWYGSDVGRQRQGNEDNFFVRAPIFVVADGMGGAQAGEVASQMAVEAFEPGMPDGGSQEEALASIIREANRRIHAMSRADAERSGMGTTCTAIYVAEREVVLAHVGDSRCYLYRDGELTRLTRDHSLVGELIDRGKLTEEQAELHPQRSVITRALGPEADVEVDTERVEAREGDVFLLCSDGLTSMVREGALLPVLSGAPDLESAGRGLIAAANDAGGRDNITVVLLRIEDIEVGGASSQATAEAPVVDAAEDDGYEDVTPDAPGPRQGVTRPSAEPPTRAAEGAPATADVAAPVRASDAEEAQYREFATTALPAVPRETPHEGRVAPARSTAPPAAARGATRAPEPPRKKKRRRVPGGLVFGVIVLLVLGVSAWVATRAVFFVGLDDRRTVTVYRGLPYELPGGLDLYSRHYTSGVTVEQVPPARRAAFTDHKLRTLDDASDLVEQAELGKLAE